MLTGRSFSAWLGPIILLVFSTLYCKTASADPLLGVDTTSTGNLQDTVNFIVFDYSTATFLGAQPMPIDRPFNIKVINIPADTTIDTLNIAEIEPRSRRTRYKFHNGQLVTPPELDTMLIVRVIRCGGGTLKTKPGEQIFMVPHNLIPNRNYVVSFAGHAETKLSAEQKEEARATLKPIIRDDPYFNKIIRKDFNDRYLNPTHSPKPLKLSQDSLHTHLQRLVQKQYPQYKVYFPDSKSDTVHIYYSFGDQVNDLRDHMTNLENNCISKLKSPPTQFVQLKNKLATDTSGAMDTVLRDAKTLLKSLSAGDCQFTVDFAVNNIDSINTLLDSAIYGATASMIASYLLTSSTIGSTYYVDIVKNAQRNVTLDVGGGYSWGMDMFFAYYAVDIYLRPIDKNLPLWNTNYGFWDYLGSRTSFQVGLTLTSVKQPKVRSGIVGDDGLILGAGFRLLPWFKVSAGTLVYNRLNNDPLVSGGAKTHFGLFASASIDLDVKSIFSSIPIINQLVIK
jgi:hypothetical protein